MNEPITITATVAAWVSSGYTQRDLMAAIEVGDSVAAINALTFCETSEEDFGDFLRVGEAEVTVTLIPRNEQAALMVKALQDKLEEERGKWLERQQAILNEISKLQALTYEAAA
jgi:hypothetical protein